MALLDYLADNRKKFGPSAVMDNLKAATGTPDDGFAIRRYINDGYGGRGGRGANATAARGMELDQALRAEAEGNAQRASAENIAGIDAGAKKFAAGVTAVGNVAAAGLDAFLNNKQSPAKPVDPLDAIAKAEELRGKLLANTKTERELSAPPEKKIDDGAYTREIMGYLDKDYGPGGADAEKLDLSGYARRRYTPAVGESEAEENPAAELALDRVNNMYLERYGKPFFDRVDARARQAADPERKLLSSLTNPVDRAAYQEAKRRLAINPQDAAALKAMQRLKPAQ